MLKVFSKFFLSSGAVLGTFAATGNLPMQKKGKEILFSDSPKKDELGKIESLEDIEIFERKHNCSFSFVHKWGSQEVYSIKRFLEENKANEISKKYTEKAIKKANEFKQKCKDKEVLALFYWYDDFALKGHLAED